MSSRIGQNSQMGQSPKLSSRCLAHARSNLTSFLAVGEMKIDPFEYKSGSRRRAVTQSVGTPIALR